MISKDRTRVTSSPLKPTNRGTQETKDNTLDFPPSPTKTPRPKNTPLTQEVEHHEISPQDSISNVGSVRESNLLGMNAERVNQVSGERTQGAPWSAVVAGDMSPDAQQCMSRYVVGTCLQRFTAPDPLPETITAYLKESTGRRGVRSLGYPRKAKCLRKRSTGGSLLLSWLLEEPVVVVRHRQGVVDCRLRPFCCYCFCRGS